MINKKSGAGLLLWGVFMLGRGIYRQANLQANEDGSTAWLRIAIGAGLVIAGVVIILRDRR